MKRSNFYPNGEMIDFRLPQDFRKSVGGKATEIFQQIMDIILYTDGLYTLVPVTKQMLSDIALYTKVNCFDLCDILRIKLTTYHDAPFNRHVMNDGSGDFFGCICN